MLFLDQVDSIPDPGRLGDGQAYQRNGNGQDNNGDLGFLHASFTDTNIRVKKAGDQALTNL
jgi:hypothetical protein